jgi:hypothetical protein
MCSIWKQKKEREIKNSLADIANRKNQLENRKRELDSLIQEQNIRLEKIASLTAEEAKRMLMENMVEKAKTDVSATLREIRDKAKVEAKKDAQKIVVNAIQRTAVDHAVGQLVGDDFALEVMAGPLPRTAGYPPAAPRGSRAAPVEAVGPHGRDPVGRGDGTDRSHPGDASPEPAGRRPDRPIGLERGRVERSSRGYCRRASGSGTR